MTPTSRASRLTEALLLLLVVALLALGTLSVLTAKRKSLGETERLNLNRATASQLQPLLSGATSKFVESRRNDGDLEDVDGLVRRKILAAKDLKPIEDKLSVREFSEFAKSLWLVAGSLSGFFFLTHLFLRRARPDADPFLLPATAMLTALGILLLVGNKDPVQDKLSFAAQAWGAIFGGGAVLILSQLRPLWKAPLHRYGYLYGLGAAGLVALVAVAGRGPGGVKLTVGGVFQPVELAKVLMVFFLASYLAERGPGMAEARRFLPRRQDALPLLAMYALPLAIFALLKDLGPALVLFGLFLALVYAATGRKSYVALGLATLALGGWLGYAAGFGVFRGRVAMVASPWNNDARGGDQLAAGLWGMASGAAGGSGLGLGGTRFIPRGGSDLIFASVGEELGLPGVLIVLLCLTVLVVRGVRIALRAKSDFERLVAAGLASLLGIQAIVIVAGNLGLFPLTGITLPLVAYGKSSLVTTFFAIGLLYALSGRGASAAEPDAPYPKTLPRLGLALAVLLLPIPLLRCVYLQALGANDIALRQVAVKDADGEKRPHTNPRLLSLAKGVERGRLLDREGRVLAETKGRIRVYPYGESSAHLVGFLDPALGGPTGFEERFQWRLKGFDGPEQLLTLWRTKDMPGFKLPEGRDVRVSLDAELQKAAYRALRGKKGAAVFLDPNTGEVLAAASWPSFDPNGLTPDTFQELQADKKNTPLFSRAISARYPPGSTFKIVTAGGLLQSGRGDLTMTIGHSARNLTWKLDGKNFGRARIDDDEEGGGARSVNLIEALAHSSNVYFAKAGIELGPDALRAIMADFGFGKVPSRDALGPGLAEAGFGQGPILTTPLEMAVAVGTVGAGGKRFETSWELGESPKEITAPLTPEQAAKLGEGLRAVVTRGTAKGVDFPLPTSGKTGTAQVGGGKKPHSWFVGYAPAKDPKVAFAAIVENGGYGARNAAPIASRLLGELPPGPR